MALTFDHVQSDTIAAIATAISESGIGIVRISGPEAIEIAAKVYRNKKGVSTLASWKTNTIHYGYIVDEKENKIDEVMVSLMKAPGSYTTEDTVEINTHGGPFIMKRVLDLVLAAGARMAEPGEFTKRAFLGGRIDLSEAEAVMDLISSSNEFARKNALSQLNGAVSNKVKELRSRILYELAFIESALDDPDSYDLQGYPEHLAEVCDDLIGQMTVIIRNEEDGRIMKEGIRTVIAGKPNAGKSSLLNYMAGDEIAIVTDVAGTTRDTISESVRMNGVVLHITDTAGIHDTEDKVEKIGIRKAVDAVEKADLILFLMDSSSSVSEEDRRIAEMISERMEEGSHCIVLLNKNDLEAGTDISDAVDLFEGKTVPPVISCSLSTGDGLQELAELLEDMFRTGKIMHNNEIYLTNARQMAAMEEALTSMQLVRQSIEDGMSEDFFSIDLMTAYSALGRIIGEAVEDDLVEEIFSKFCLGK